MPTADWESESTEVILDQNECLNEVAKTHYNNAISIFLSY